MAEPLDLLDDDEEEIEPERIMPMEEIRDNMLSAAKLGDVELATEMIEKWQKGEHGITPVEDTTAAWTPLLWAASKGFDELVDLFIKNEMGNIYLHKPGEEDVKLQMATPLQWAAFKGHVKIVHTLLRAGMQIQDVDDCGNNALHLACTGGHSAIMQTLLAHGCDINVRNRYGNNPLGMCSDKDCRELLLKAVNQEKCQFDGTEFGVTKWRYLCSCCGFFFQLENTALREMHREVGSDEIKLVRLCRSCEPGIKAKEEELRAQMVPETGWEAVINNLVEDELVPLGEAVSGVTEIGGGCGDPDLIHEGTHLHTELSGSLNLKAQVKEVQASRPLADGRGTKSLALAIVRAIEMDVKPEMVNDAKKLVKVALLEVKLTRAMGPLSSVICAAKDNEKDMGKLLEAIRAVTTEGAVETELFKSAEKLHDRLTTEVDITGQLKKLTTVRDAVLAKETELAAKMEVIDALKGKKKKTALKNLKAEEAAITSDMVQEELVELQEALERLTTSAESGTTNEANAELLGKSEESIKWLQKELKTTGDKFEEKKVVEEKEAAKRAKKAKKKKGKA
jgi:ankyrin repeat protein